MPSETVRSREQGVEVERHLAAAAEDIAIAESADAKRAAYERAADHIIAAQNADSTLSQRDIGKHVGKSGDWVGDLVRWRTSGDDVPTPFSKGAPGRMDREVSATRTIARDRPADFAQAFEQAPPDAKRQIAERIGRSPEVRTAARQADQRDTERTRPSPVPPRPDHTLFEFEAKLVGARRYLRDAIALVNELDQPGNDEDLIDLLTSIEQLAQVAREAYRTGKSLDTWAQELYERSAD